MATIKMRINKKGERVFDIRVKFEGTVYCKKYPGDGESKIPET